jgi:hypothetical protein
MGDVADAMLDGDLCEQCGVYMEGGAGYPQTCSACRRANREQSALTIRPMAAKVACPTCGKKVKAAGLADHQRDAHSAPKTKGEQA